MTASQPPYGSPQPQGPQAGQLPPPYQGSYQGPYQGQYAPNPYAPWGVDRYGRPLSDKSRLTAGLLGIFLGSIGIGRFYLGYTTIGVLQIVVTIFTLGFGGLWGFIDGIFILTGNVPDAQGRTLRE